MSLRYAGQCVNCKVDLPAATKAWWDSTSKAVSCCGCHGSLVAATAPIVAAPLPFPPPPQPMPAAPAVPIPIVSNIEAGDAGASAQREYDRRSAEHTKKIEERWGTGKIGSIAKFVIDEPQSTKAWAKGAHGERELAGHLQRDLSPSSVLLNDRKVKGTKGNIDHIVVTQGGVWIIDAKNYKGKVERRDVGGLFKTDVRLFVNNRDQTKAVKGMEWQRRVVVEALASFGRSDVPVHQALCFTNAEWPLLAKAGKVEDVWILWAKKLVSIANESKVLSEGDVAGIAMNLSVIFPAS